MCALGVCRQWQRTPASEGASLLLDRETPRGRAMVMYEKHDSLEAPGLRKMNVASKPRGGIPLGVTILAKFKQAPGLVAVGVPGVVPGLFSVDFAIVATAKS